MALFIKLATLTTAFFDLELTLDVVILVVVAVDDEAGVDEEEPSGVTFDALADAEELALAADLGSVESEPTLDDDDDAEIVLVVCDCEVLSSTRDSLLAVAVDLLSVVSRLGSSFLLPIVVVESFGVVLATGVCTLFFSPAARSTFDCWGADVFLLSESVSLTDFCCVLVAFVKEAC